MQDSEQTYTTPKSSTHSHSIHARSRILDIIIGNLAGGITALVALIILCAVAAMTPSLPGWSAGLFVVVAFVFLLMNSTAAAFAGPLLLIAAVLGALAAYSKKRARDSAARGR
jgi:hypothetical protein